MTVAAEARLDYESLDDLALAARVAQRDAEAVRLLVTRNNQRLYRTARSILRNPSEAEDAVQSAYLNAFSAIVNFEGRSSLSTWLTRITINEALSRVRAADRRRKALHSESVSVIDDYREKLMRGSLSASSPDSGLARQQIRAMIEIAIGRLPEAFRTVFVLREIEELSVEETAEVLGIDPVTVRTRHLRARRRLQGELTAELKDTLGETFPFAGGSCAALTERVVIGLVGRTS
jgi:RNA polymerase sigma-70 factor, ECF subfamily